MSPFSKKTALAVVAVTAIGAAVVLLSVELGGDREDTPAPDRGGDTGSGETPESPGADPGAARPEADASAGRSPTLFGEDTPLQEIIRRNSTWNPPRPLRLVVRRTAQRDREAARARAEEARRRFLAGESAYALIRELSDPPRGIPEELLRRYEDLPPTQASPVLEIASGYAVLFGTPTSPPDAGP